MEFPLKSDFFPRVRLTAEDKQHYLTTVDTSVQVLRNSILDGQWTRAVEKDGVALSKAHYIEEYNGNATPCLVVRATVYASGTISEVLEAIASPVTDDYRKAMTFLYKSRFLDGMCLHTILPNGSRNTQAFTTIKWAAFNDGKALNQLSSPIGTDYCFLEHSGIQKEESKNEIYGFSVQESIVREREVPSLAGFGIARGEFHRTGIIILPTERKDVVQVSSILQMCVDQQTNKATLEILMQKRVAAIGRIDLLLERRRLSKMQFIPRENWVANDARKVCAVCSKAFALRRRKHHCRNCGEVVCSSCAPPKEVDVNNYGVALIRICTACVVQARTGNLPLHPNGHHQDVFVYHIRSTLSSRTSTNSSLANGEIESHHHHQRGRHQQSISSSSRSSNFSISSDSFDAGNRLPSMEDHWLGAYTHDVHDRYSSASSSNFSLSDLNTFDENFGNMMSSSSPPVSRGSCLRGSLRSSTLIKHTLYEEEPPEMTKSTYDRSKLVEKYDQPEIKTAPAATQSRDIDIDDYDDFHHLVDRFTSSSNQDHNDADEEEYDDLLSSSSLSDCTSTGSYSDLLECVQSLKHETTATINEENNDMETKSLDKPSHPVSPAAQRASSASTSSATVDIDMVIRDDFTLLCPEIISRRKNSYHSQDAGEQRRSRLSSISNLSEGSLLDDNDLEIDENMLIEKITSVTAMTPTPEAEEAKVSNQDELFSYRQQMNGLADSLYDVNAKLSYVEPTNSKVQSEYSDNEDEMRQPELITELSLSPTAMLQQPRRPSHPSLDPMLVQRKESYNALISELHEIMGLPPLTHQPNTATVQH